MGDFLATLCSPKVGLVLVGPILALVMLKGCEETMKSRPRPRPRRG